MARKFEWHSDPPVEDGDFFYTGPTPDGTAIMAIVQVFDNPKGGREACVFIPPNWRGLGGLGIMHHGPIELWKGQWSGPEYGLCCICSSFEEET